MSVGIVHKILGMMTMHLTIRDPFHPRPVSNGADIDLSLYGQSIEEWRDLDVVHETDNWSGQQFCVLVVAKEAKCHAEGCNSMVAGREG